MKKQTMTKRFYVASNLMSDGTAEKRGWLRILPEAITEAERRLESHPLMQEVYVVEVIRIVRRAVQPIEVIEVRK